MTEYEKLRIEREKIRVDAERRMRFVDECMESEKDVLPKGRLNRFDQEFDEKSVRRIVFVTDLHMGHRLHESEIGDSLVRPLRSLVGKEEDVILIFGGDQVNNNMQEKFYEKVFELDRRIRRQKVKDEEEEEGEQEEEDSEDERSGGKYVSVFYAAGNHDMTSSHDTTGLDFRKKFFETYGKSFGTIRIGKTMKIIVTNTGSGVFGLKQLKLLEEALQDRHEYQFCVLVSHYSFTWRYGNHYRDWEEIANVTKLLKTYSVDATFCGHTHQWEYGSDCGLHHFTLSHRKLGTIPLLDIRISPESHDFTVERFDLRPKYSTQLERFSPNSDLEEEYPKLIPTPWFQKKKIPSKKLSVQSKLNTILNLGIFEDRKKKNSILELGNHGNNITYMKTYNNNNNNPQHQQQKKKIDIGGGPKKKDSFRMNEFSWWASGKDSEEDGSTKASETYIWDGRGQKSYIQIKKCSSSGYFHPPNNNSNNVMEKEFIGVYSCDRGRSFPIRIFEKEDQEKYIHFFYPLEEEEVGKEMKILFSVGEEEGKKKKYEKPIFKLEELNSKCFVVEMGGEGVLYMMWIQRMVRCINPSFFWIFVKNEAMVNDCVSVFVKKE